MFRAKQGTEEKAKKGPAACPPQNMYEFSRYGRGVNNNRDNAK